MGGDCAARSENRKIKVRAFRLFPHNFASSVQSTLIIESAAEDRIRKARTCRAWRSPITILIKYFHV